MSTTQIIHVPQYRLKTIDDIKNSSGYSELSCSDCHTSGFKRVEELGKSIEVHLNKFSKSFSKIIKDLPSETKDLLAKNYSLQESLKSSDNSLFSKAAIHEAEKNIPYSFNLVQNFLNNKVDFSLSNLPNLNDQLKHNFDSLQAITKGVHLNLLSSEKEVLKNKTIYTLSVLGYNVKNINKSSQTLIRAKKNDVSIAVTIDKNSEIALDMAGFEGSNCRKELDVIHSELKKQGLDLSVKEDAYHGKKEGGVLSQKVTREFEILFSKSKSKSNKVIQNNKINHFLKSKLKLKK